MADEEDIRAHKEAVGRAVEGALPERRGRAPIAMTLLALALCLPGDWLYLNGVVLQRLARRFGPLGMVVRTVALLPLLAAAPFHLLRAMFFSLGDALAGLGGGEFRRLTTWPAVPGNPDAAGDLVIVPGYAADTFHGALTPRGKDRLALAAEDFHAGRAAYVLVSGGNVHPSGTQYNEACEMRRHLVEALSVPADRVIIEPLAEHTPTNLRNAARYMLCRGIKRAIVVSDAHVFGQSIMLQAPHSLMFGVLTRVRLMYGHTLGRLVRIDDARTLFEPSADVMLTRRGVREP